MSKQFNNYSLFSNTNQSILVDVLENSQDLAKDLVAEFVHRDNFSQQLQLIFNNNPVSDRLLEEWQSQF